MAGSDTETKIKEAARKIFQQKGFAETKTRDIASAADINLALLNYYFRSKRKLFNIIMLETITTFFDGIYIILNDPDTSIKRKITLIVERYIFTLSENPNVPNFILNEIKQSPKEFNLKIGLLDNLKNSVFHKQFLQAVEDGKVPPINPVHFMMNLSSMIIFPFIASPLIMEISKMNRKQLKTIMEERKRLIPLWIESMLKVS